MSSKAPSHKALLYTQDAGMQALPQVQFKATLKK
jgi:hypothetical protein